MRLCASSASLSVSPIAAISAAMVALAPSAACVPATDAAVAARPGHEPPDSTMQEFIVKYRSGSRDRWDADRLYRVLREIEAGFVRAAGLRRVSRVSSGSDVIRADRALDRSEALALMRRIASDPRVDYVLPGGKEHARKRRLGDDPGEDGIDPTGSWSVEP